MTVQFNPNAQNEMPRSLPEDTSFRTMTASQIEHKVWFNPTEQQAYITSLEHEMGDIQNKMEFGTATQADYDRLELMQAQIDQVIHCNSSPEAAEFNKELAQKRDSARTINVSLHDWLVDAGKWTRPPQ